MSIMKPSFLTILFSALWGMSLIATAADEANMREGKAFSDPTKKIEMPIEWMKRPIEYKEDWAKGADLAVSSDQEMPSVIINLVEQYGKEHNINIRFREGTCGTSAKSLIDKVADIGGFCCPASEADRMPNLKFHTLAIAAIALLVNKKNPIDNVTFEQAQDIFGGQIARWSDVKVNGKSVGSDKNINVIGRLHCKQRVGHWRLLLDTEELFSPRMFEVSAIKDMVSEVANKENAIGLESLWMALNRYKDVEDRVKTISVNGISPADRAKLASGEYPMYYTYHMSTWEGDNKNKYAEGLINYLMVEIEKLDPALGLVPASELRKAGWQFHDTELIGKPKKK